MAASSSSIPSHEFLQHDAWLRRLAPRLLRDPARAEDAVQDAWLAALERPPRHGKSVRAWLARAATHRAASAARRDAARADREALAAAREADATADDAARKAELVREVADAVLALAEPYRSTLLWRFFDDLPPRAIARRTGRPVDTVRTHVERGLAQVRARLDARGGARERWAPALVALARRGAEPAGAAASPAILALGASAARAAVGIAALVGLITLATRGRPADPGQGPDAGPDATVAALDREPRDPAEAAPGAPAAEDDGRRAVESAAAIAAPADPAPRALQGVLLDETGAPLADRELRFLPRAGWTDRADGLRAAESDEGLRADESDERLRAGESDERSRASRRAPEDARAPSRGDLDRARPAAGDAPPPATTARDGTFTLETGGLAIEDGEVVPADPDLRVVVQGAISPDRADGRPIFVAARVAPIAGRVVDERGEPVEGAAVCCLISAAALPAFPLGLTQPWLRWRAVTVADPTGAFALDVPQGCGAWIEASAPRRRDARRPAGAADGAPLVLVLEPDASPPRIAGRVVDAAGRPVAGARLAFGDSGSHAQGADDGRFEIELSDAFDDGDELVAFAPGAGRASVAGLAAAVRKHGEVRDLIVALDRPPPALSGRVVDAAGRPLAGVRVSPYDRTVFGGAWGGLEELIECEDETDADGRFELAGLAPRATRLVCSRTEPALWLLTEPIEPGANALVRVPEDSTRPAIAGRVVDHRRRPIEGVSVRVTLPEWTHAGGTATRGAAAATTDGAGAFRLEHVPRRGAALHVLDPTSARAGHTSFAIEDLPEGDVELVVPRVVRFRVDLAPDDPANRFRLLDAAGEPIMTTAFRANSTVYFDQVPRDATGAFPVCETTDATVELVLERDGEELRRVAFDPAGVEGLWILRL